MSSDEEGAPEEELNDGVENIEQVTTPGRALALRGSERQVAMLNPGQFDNRLVSSKFQSPAGQAMGIKDGDFRGANVGSTTIINKNVTNNVKNVIIKTPGEQENTPHKLMTKKDEPGYVHLGGNIYVDLYAPLAKGARVYKGQRRSEAMGADDIAVKLESVNTREEAEPLLNEAKMIRELPHTNIVQFLHADFSTERLLCMYIAMELCHETNLHDHVVEMKRHSRRFKFSDCMSVAKQLSAALVHIQRRNILHRDIKPSNIVFSRDRRILKLTDFSLTKPLRPGRSVTVDSHKRIGTDAWRAPEVYVRNIHSKKSDVYSSGLTLYYVWSNGEQAFGSDPDLANFNIKLNRNRDLSKIKFPDMDDVETLTEAEDLVKNMLIFEEDVRISALEISNHRLCKNADNELVNPDGIVDRRRNEPEVEGSEMVEGSCIVVFDRKTTMIQAFKPSTKKWGHLQALPPDMTNWNMTIVCVSEYLYAFSETRRVFCIKYTDSNAIWHIQDDMLLEHGGLPSTSALNGYIYAIGGSQWSSQISKEGERFCLESETWSRIPDMLTDRKVHSVVSCGDHVYSLGGRSDSARGATGREGVTGVGERFDPRTKKWELIAPMNGPRHAAYAASLNEKIYILGGWRAGKRLREVECYDTTTNYWTMLREMNVPRSYHSAVAMEGKLYAVNGDAESPLTIEEYDPAKDEWTIIEKMSSMLIWSCVSAVVHLPRRQGGVAQV